MKKLLYIDLDGVLADFDGGYEKLFGVRPDQDNYEPPDMWDNIRSQKAFYRDLPEMPGMHDLWKELTKFDPDATILTGVPYSIPDVAKQKRDWVLEHLGPTVDVIPCRSIDKHKYGVPGDILVDDRLKYSNIWTNMGGLFVHHVDNLTTVRRVAALWRLA